jgi:hypothetical protein
MEGEAAFFDGCTRNFFTNDGHVAQIVQHPNTLCDIYGVGADEQLTLVTNGLHFRAAMLFVEQVFSVGIGE